jgi:hypothetical protein
LGVFLLYKAVNPAPPMPNSLKEIQKDVEKWIIDIVIEEEKEKKGKEVADSLTLLQLSLKLCWNATETIKSLTVFIIPFVFPFLFIIDSQIISYFSLTFSE